VLDPGAGKTQDRIPVALARDDRPWGGGVDAAVPAEHRGSGPPAVAYSYAPGRGGEHAAKLLDGFNGILQVDGYAAYKKLAAPTRHGGPVTLAYCWSHLRRQFYEVYVGDNAPIATKALARIKLLYDIEAEVRGSPPEVRRAARQQRSKPVIEALKPWFEDNLAGCQRAASSPRQSPTASTIGTACALPRRWPYRDRLHTVERSIRGLALTRKNALFAGHDRGAAGWAMIASLLETCKLNVVILWPGLPTSSLARGIQHDPDSSAPPSSNCLWRDEGQVRLRAAHTMIQWMDLAPVDRPYRSRNTK